MKDDEALTRRAARAARRAALEARSHNGDDAATGPVQAAREAATAAAVGAAVGAVRALAARQGGEREAESDEAQPNEPEPNEPEPNEPQPQPAEQPAAEAEQAQPAPPPPPREGAKPSEVDRAVRAAREQLRDLHGADAESISSFGRTREGWRVTLEVLELRRIPETTDVLASYLVELDGDGNLVAYERLRRYQRSEAHDGSSS